MNVQPYGVSSFAAQPVEVILLENARGRRAEILVWSATLRALHMPGMGGTVNVVLGFESFEDYPAKSPYFGATIGRFANRICGGCFVLDGRAGRHTLHSGADNFSMRIWSAEVDTAACAARLRLRSLDGDEGFPGDVEATCAYTITEDDMLRTEMAAVVGAPTLVNLAHHSSWNLVDSATTDAHRLEVTADRYLPVNEDTIPTGIIAPVEGTPYDFRRRQPLDAFGPPAVDHCLVLMPGHGLQRMDLFEGTRRHPAPWSCLRTSPALRSTPPQARPDHGRGVPYRPVGRPAYGDGPCLAHGEVGFNHRYAEPS